MKPESETIVSIMNGYKKSFILATAIKLDLFNKIHSTFSDISSLAASCVMNNESMKRFLRVLECMEFVNINENKVELTSRGLCTLIDSELQDYLLISSCNWIQDWSNLFEILTIGKQSDGTSWNQRAKNPKVDFAFHQFMVSSQSNVLNIPININEGKIIDLGGGLGFTLASVLNNKPNVRGVLFDLPHVIKHAKNLVLSHMAYQGRCEFVDGSFLEIIPSGGDLYLLNNILHDWDDEYVKKILKNIYQAMRPGAKLVITEIFIPESNNDEYAAMTDIHLMVVHGGRKRTLTEYQKMLSIIGFNTLSTTFDSIEVEK
ncbi:MAG: methyltransferase [Parachlamydiaceae bacterium]|nr:methyltransferase [Parachlamydiaceae bacterium]